MAYFFQTVYNQHLSIQKEILKLASQVMQFTCTVYNMERFRTDTQRATLCLADRLIDYNIDLCLGTQSLNDLFTLTPIYSSEFYLYAPNREPKLESTYFLSVFEFKLWMCMFFTIFLMIVLLYIYGKLQKWSISLLTLVLDVFQIATGNMPEKLKPSFKLLTLVIGLFLFLLASSFSAELITYLLKLDDDFPIKELSDVWTQKEYALCIGPREFKHKIFMEMDKTGLVVNGKDCPAYMSSRISDIDVICSSKNAIFLSSPEILIMHLKERSEK